MKSPHHIVVVLAVLACGSCAADPASTAVPLAECVRGWWLDSAPVTPCDGACGATPNPECAFADCTEYSFFGYLDGGAYYENRFSYSATAGTMSSTHAATVGTYTVLDHSVRMTPTGWEPNTTCSGPRLQQALVPWNRASDAFGMALDRATTTGTAPAFSHVAAPSPGSGTM
jgi:hypothetical protein